jgi:hypothetical protein
VSVLWQYDQGCNAVEGGHLGAIRHLFCAVRCSSQYCYGTGFLLKEWYVCCCGWYSLLYVIVVALVNVLLVFVMLCVCMAIGLHLSLWVLVFSTITV